MSTATPAANHPLLRTRRTSLIVTPHVAWRTDVAASRLAEQLIRGIETHVD